jgi:hypothetical protein
MSKKSQAGFEEIRKDIRSFEAFLFQSRQPVEIKKIDCDSHEYDAAYDSSVRKKENYFISLLNELMLVHGKKSEAWLALNRMEKCLSSSEFYRDMIFAKAHTPFESHLNDFKKGLIEDLKFSERGIDDDDYCQTVELYSYPFPKNRKDFFDAVIDAFLAQPAEKFDS